MAENTGLLLEWQDGRVQTRRQKIFTNPKDKRTEDYITGRFGLMARIKFQQSLGRPSKEHLLVMAGMAEQAIQRSIEAYQVARSQHLRACFFRSRAPRLIGLSGRSTRWRSICWRWSSRWPIDLRFILSVIRINADLERVGDQAVNIAVRVREMGAFANIDLPVDIPRLASLASGDGAVRRCRRLLRRTPSWRQSVLQLDDQVDQMNDAAFYALSTLIKEKPELTPQSLNALIIARNLERVGDHATNIAEDVIFWVRGADVRHKSSVL